MSRLQVYMRCHLSLFSRGIMAMSPGCYTSEGDREQPGELSQDQPEALRQQPQPCWCQRPYLSGCMAEGQIFWIITCMVSLSHQLAFLSITTA